MKRLAKMSVFGALFARSNRRLRVSATEAHAPIDPDLLPVDLSTLSFSLFMFERRRAGVVAPDGAVSDDVLSGDVRHDEDVFLKAA